MRRLLILATSIFLITPQIARACTITWTGKGGDKNWTTAGNWDTNQIPGPKDDVCIGSGFRVNTVDGKNIGTILSLTLDGSLTLNDVSIVLTNPSATSTIYKLALSGPKTQVELTVNGTANFTGTVTLLDGAVVGPGTSIITGAVRASGEGNFVATASVTNQGKIMVAGNGGLTLGTVSFTNASDGLIDLQGDGSTVLTGGTLNNLGSVVKSIGTGTSYFGTGGTFTNNGKIEAQSGILQLRASFTNAGAFSASSGATLQFTNIVTLNAGTKLTGAGTMDILNGVWDVETPVVVDSTNLAFDGGQPAIRGSSNLTINSTTVTWNSGTLGALTGSTMTLTKKVRNMQILTTGSHALEMNLDLFGTVNMSADLNLSGGTVTIEPNAKFNVLTDNGIHGSGIINNGGIFQKVKGTLVSTLDYGGTFNIVGAIGSHPAVMANMGVLEFAVSGGGSLGGIWTVGSGATLEFSTGNYSLPDGFQFSGGGTIKLTYATWTLASGTTGIFVDTSRFYFLGDSSAGIIQGSNNLTVNSTTFLWNGGKMLGPGTTTIPASTTLTMDSVAAIKPLVYGRTINNSGTAVIANGATTLLFGGGAVWNNQTGSTFTFKRDGNIGDNGGGGTFNNDGIVQKTNAGRSKLSTISFTGDFNNNATGQVIVAAGTLQLSPTQGTSAGAFVAANSGTVLKFLGQPSAWKMNTGTTMTGAGTFALGGVTWTLGDNLSVSSGFVMDPANPSTITGAFDLRLTGTANIILSGSRTGGNRKNSKAPAGGCSLTIPNAATQVQVEQLSLNSCTLDNSAAVQITGTSGTLGLSASSALLNQASARIALGIPKGSSVPAISGDGSSTVTNGGLITLSTGSGANPTQTISTQPGNFISSGTVSVPAKRMLDLVSLAQTGGTTSVATGGTLASTGTLTMSGGTFGGSGNLFGSVDNAGADLEAGNGNATSILNLNTPLTQGSGGAISAIIGGTTAGTQYDQINSTSSMALAGTLNLQFGNGFTPAPTDSFDILNFSSVTGNFSTVNAPSGWTAQLNYTGTALNVQFSQNGLRVSINPKAATVKVNGTTQFKGKVVGASKNGETWSVKESEGGTVSQTGLYAAPATPGTYHVVVASVADARQSDTATVTVTALEADKITVAPSAAVLQPGAVLRLQVNQPAMWSVAEGRAGGSVTAGGSYTAPRQPGLYHVVATGAEGSNHAVANVAVTRGNLESAFIANLDKNSVSVLAGLTGGGLTSGQLRETESLAAGQAPVALAISPNGKLLLSANQNSNDISVFALLHGDGALSVLPGTSFAAGAQPSSVAFDPTGSFAFVTNKGSDDISVFSVDASGQLVLLESRALAVGDRPSVVAVHPSGSVIYVINAGANSVRGFIYDTAGMLKPVDESPIATGMGPAAEVIDSAGKFLFVANRGSNDVSVFAIDATDQTLQEVSGSPFKAGNGAAALAIDLTGSYLFVADHQVNDIASLQIDSETGALTLIGSTPLRNAGPSALAVDPSGEYLYVTSDKVGGAATLKLDVTTGTLVPTGETTATGEASSIVLGIAAATTQGP